MSKGRNRIPKRYLRDLNKKIRNMGDDRPAWMKKKYAKDSD